MGRPLTFGSLFAGIGGFDLGFERAGMRCAWQVEIDDYCRRVLAKHWPDVRRHDDVRTFPPLGDWYADVICGGFPCQDISNAGKRAGIMGERSGLWSEFARIVRVVRPRFVVVENVAALLGRGLDRVLGDLAACGYDAEWDCIPAAAVGAPHRRDRVWVVAYPGVRGQSGGNEQTEQAPAGVEAPRRYDTDGLRAAVPDPFQSRLEGVGIFGTTPNRIAWGAEPGVCRVATRSAATVDRLRGLGNAVVPQVAEFIGRRIVASLEDQP